MNIRNFFSNITGRSENVLHTSVGSFNLARSKDRKRLQNAIIEIRRSTDALTRKDIADWRQAWQNAINIDYPNRRQLYDIYRDVEADAHLSGCVGQRMGFVMAKSFKLVGSDGKENEEAIHYFDQGWFKQLCRLVLSSPYWGHSLIQLGDLILDGDGCPCYSRVQLIPRKHVVPEYGRVVTNVWGDWRTGIDYHEAPFTDWLIEAGQPDDLGLFLKAAQHTIPKKNMMSFWDTFGEIFGMPMRIARTGSRDPKERQELEKMMINSGLAQYLIAGLDTEIQFIENGKGDAFNVYDKRIDRANSELSKLLIGQTMTIEDGSSLSQSQTHLKVFENLVEEDADMLRDVVNNQLIPRMVKHGFPVKGLRFEWDDSVDYTPEQQVAYESMLLNNFEVDPRYFVEKYGITLGERRSSMPMMPGGDDKAEEPDNKTDDEKGKKKEEEEEEPQQQKNARPFFD